MRDDKFKAYKLRAGGRSYTEIERLLNIPKSTLSGWFATLVLSEESQERIRKRVNEGSIKALLKRNKNQTHLAEERARQIRLSARSSLGKISNRELMLIGVALYWAEGHKKPIVKDGRARTYHPVRLSNSDPLLISIFLKFLREVCFVPDEKITANLRIFDHQNEGYVLDFWQKITKIPYSAFKKPYKGVSISSQHKKPFNILPYGTLQIIVSDTKLYHKIMGWIEGLSKM